MHVKDLELINNINILLENKIILYGASSQGKSAYRALKDVGIDILGYCDSDSKKWGTEISGKKVFSIDELTEFQDENILVIITSDWFREILNNLEDNYDIKFKICTQFGLMNSLYNKADKLKDGKRFFENKKIWSKMKQVSDGYKIYGGSIEQALEACDKGRIFLLQPGKVGSCSIRDSILKNETNDIGVCQNHGLLYVKDEIKDYLDNTRKNKKIKIISLCREPISRDMSLLFAKMGYLYKIDGIISEKIEDYYFDFLKKQYCCDKIPENNNLYEKWMSSTMMGGEKRNLYGYFGWYNTEFKELFDIDILKYNFDQEKGYTIIKENNVEILLMKTEKLDNLENVIRDFIEWDKFKLLKTNIGNNKIYSYSYNDFKKTVKLPKEYVDLYYKDNKYMDYFYSKKEKEEFYSKWKQFIV